MKRNTNFPLPANCIVIMFPLMEVNTLLSEGYTQAQIRFMFQAYVDARCFLPETESGDSLKTDFDTWRMDLSKTQLDEIVSQKVI